MECKSLLDIENDNFSNCSTSSFNRSEHIISRRTSPVPLNIDSLFHVRLTNSYFAHRVRVVHLALRCNGSMPFHPFILVLPTKLHL